MTTARANKVSTSKISKSLVSKHHHHGNTRMMSHDQMYSIIDDEDEDSSDVKEVLPCPPYMSPVGYSSATPRHMSPLGYGGSTPRQMQPDGIGDQIKMERGGMFLNFDTSQASTSMSFNTVTATAGSHTSVKQREASEYNYAQALLKQAPKLTNSGDLDGGSVIRLARAYITLQQGLKSWESSGNKTKWWPDYLDGGKLTLAAQETMNCFVLIMTHHGHIVYVSDAVESLLGHDQIHLVGRSIQNVVPQDELPVLAAQFSLSIGPTGRSTIQRSFYTRMLNIKSVSQQQRYELVHMSGHLQDVSLTTGQSSPGVQRETWLMCACKVMTPQIEEEGNHAPVTEWISHNALDGKILYMDSKSCQVTGYLPHEMVGRSTYCFIHPDDQEHVVFSHNQALINVGGSSCTYRMFRRSNDLIYVHTTTQLARDKQSNKPSFLFCINQIMDEAEGKQQVSRQQQNLMSVKDDPSTKYSMNDIEKTVKALEIEGGNSPPVMSKGGMKLSKLTESCSADGGDLLRVDLPLLLRYSPLVIKTEKDQWAGSATCHSQSGLKMQYTSGSRYQQSGGQVPVSSNVPGYLSGFDSNSADPGQQQNVYSRPSQHHLYKNQYQQMDTSTTSMSHSMISTTSPVDSPVSGTGSYMDYLYDNAASPSVPSDSVMFSTDPLNSNMLASPGRARGRGRTRGRPRGSGRGGRGTTRGVRGTRGPRGSRGSRGRGRGSNIAQLSQMGEIVGGMKKSDSINMVSCGSMSPRGNISPMGSTTDLFSSPNSTMGLQRSNSTLSHHSLGLSQGEFQRMPSDGDISSSGLQRMNSDDNIMFQRMTSLDDIDFTMTQASSDDMSPRSWGQQDCTSSAQMPPFRTVHSGEYVVREKKVGRPRGSKNQAKHNLQRGKSVEDHSVLSHGSYSSNNQQTSVYNQDVSTAGQNTLSPYHAHSPRQGSSSGNNLYYQCPTQSAGNANTLRGPENFQKSMSAQNHSLNHMVADMQDPEHSILGNLLKGRGESTSSTGSKSPAHSLLMNLGRQTELPMGPERGGKSPSGHGITLDKGGRSPAHSFISDVASPTSVFSPEPSRATPSIIKDEPDLLSPYGESSSVSSTTLMISPNLIQNQQQADDYFLLDQGQHKTLSEMQMFSSQLRQKHQSLAQSLANQETMLHQLESRMQQVAKDFSPESTYSQLNARLNIIKSDKAKQEKELQLITARMEEQLRQQQPRQQQQQQIQQQLDLQRHRLGSPAPTNTRRMAIVPPIQRQPTEGEMMSNFSQHSISDLKSGVSQQENSLDDSAKPILGLSPQSTDGGVKSGSFQNHLHSGKSSAGGSAISSAQNLLHQPTQPSPFSLHHHHHHHHHYHHHPLLQPPARLQQHVEFSATLKGSPPPPPPYNSFDTSVFNSAVAAPAALSISVSTNNTSPIICDTSPVSVDESPGCGSDASSGYHSLSLGGDSAAVSASAQYNKGHCLDMPASTLPPYNSKSAPLFGQSHQSVGKSSEFIPSSGQSHTKSPPT
ncbi:uncharacterized protein LOC106067317 isoform X1 [Biomphalaria glabrata]|uniref:Uncharacterized protein LOC106067317 isoform X1 n=2 Tax=Biomphalaria glabrata TaxID=6526 RepID=A0A9W3B333_BIOGL|nr:uncharacterized protein LOC106067317 isoform X1 [Biomphalaria glabrata]